MKKQYIVKKAFQTTDDEKFIVGDRISEKTFLRNGKEKIERFLKRGYIADPEEACDEAI